MARGGEHSFVLYQRKTEGCQKKVLANLWGRKKIIEVQVGRGPNGKYQPSAYENGDPNRDTYAIQSPFEPSLCENTP